MKKRNNYKSKPVQSIIEVFDFKEAAILIHSGHIVHSISKVDKDPTSHIYRFYFTSVTPSLLEAIAKRSLEVDPTSFIDSIGDLLAHKIYFVGEGNGNEYDNKGLDKII